MFTSAKFVFFTELAIMFISVVFYSFTEINVDSPTLHGTCPHATFSVERNPVGTVIVGMRMKFHHLSTVPVPRVVPSSAHI